MARSKSSVKSAKNPGKPETIQRTYRFNTILFEAFEGDCARCLSSPKRVIEALIRQWLDANTAQRAAIAERHFRWIGKPDPADQD